MLSSEFKLAIERCDWLFDFFALGYDFAVNRVTPPTGEPMEEVYPELARRVQDLARLRMRQRLVAADGAIPRELLEYLKAGSATDWQRVCGDELEGQPFLIRLLAVLRLIDEVAADFSYFSFGISSREWPEVRTFLQQNRQALNKDPLRRVVLKPPALSAMDWWALAVRSGWKEPVPRGQFQHRIFQNLCRVPSPIDCDIEHFVICSADDAEQSITGPLKVAVIPTIERMDPQASFAALSPGPLRVKAVPPSNFTVEVGGVPADFEPMLAEVEGALRAVCGQGVHIVVFPELVVPDPVLERVQQILLSIAREDRPTPFLVVAGTFGRVEPTNGDTYNEAVVLNGRGTVIFRQRKMHAYTMQPYEQPKYALQAMFGGQPRTEKMAIVPRKLLFCDSPAAGFRVSVLICEDFCQETPGLELIRQMKGNLVLLPVMAGTLHGSGFVKAAESLASNPEAVVVVGNSRSLPSRQPCAQDESCALGIVGSPLYLSIHGGGVVNVHLLTGPRKHGALEFSLP